MDLHVAASAGEFGQTHALGTGVIVSNNNPALSATGSITARDQSEDASLAVDFSATLGKLFEPLPSGSGAASPDATASNLPRRQKVTAQDTSTSSEQTAPLTSQLPIVAANVPLPPTQLQPVLPASEAIAWGTVQNPGPSSTSTQSDSVLDASLSPAPGTQVAQFTQGTQAAHVAQLPTPGAILRGRVENSGPSSNATLPDSAADNASSTALPTQLNQVPRVTSGAIPGGSVQDPGLFPADPALNDNVPASNQPAVPAPSSFHIADASGVPAQQQPSSAPVDAAQDLPVGSLPDDGTDDIYAPFQEGSGENTPSELTASAVPSQAGAATDTLATGTPQMWSQDASDVTGSVPQTSTNLSQMGTSVSPTATNLSQMGTSVSPTATNLSQWATSVSQTVTNLSQITTGDLQTATSLPQMAASLPQITTGDLQTATSLPQMATSAPQTVKIELPVSAAPMHASPAPSEKFQASTFPMPTGKNATKSEPTIRTAATLPRSAVTVAATATDKPSGQSGRNDLLPSAQVQTAVSKHIDAAGAPSLAASPELPQTNRVIGTTTVSSTAHAASPDAPMQQDSGSSADSDRKEKGVLAVATGSATVSASTAVQVAVTPAAPSSLPVQSAPAASMIHGAPTIQAAQSNVSAGLATSPTSKSPDTPTSPAKASSVDLARAVVNTSKLVQTMGQSDLRVGMRSSEFGDISIQTSATRDSISTQIVLDHTELATSLAAHIPEMQARLGNHGSLEVRINATDQSSGAASTMSDSGAGSQGSRQQEDSSRSYYSRAHNNNSFLDTAMPAAAMATTSQEGVRTGRLDLQA